MPPKKMMVARRKAPASQKQKKSRVPQSIFNRLDEQAMCYARLLNDPCSAPLCHPVFSGADGGLVIRAENTYTVGTTASSTSSVFTWCPGAIGNNAGTGSAIATADGLAAGTGITLAGISNGYQPGYSYLSTAASEVRVVAACIQIFFPGSESNRAGLVGYGNIPGGSLIIGTSTNGQGALTLFENYERTPNGMLEVKWRPTAFDQNHTGPSSSTPSQEFARRGALGFSLVNGTASTGLIVRMVAVYEYTPANATGLTTPSQSRNTSQNTLDHVINFLDSTGEWMVKGSQAVARLANSGAAALPYVRAVGYAGRRSAAMLLA